MEVNPFVSISSPLRGSKPKHNKGKNIMFTTTTWTGSRQKDLNPRLKISPNSPFFYMHHPFSWELACLEDEWFWVPTFSTLVEMAGVNGVEGTKDGVDSGLSRLRFSELGYMILDRELEYVARYETVSGGYFYCNKFNHPKIIAGKVFWSMDVDGWIEYRKNLVEIGLIDPPHPEVIETKRIDVNRKIERRLKVQHLPEIKKEIDQLYELKKLMDETYEKMINPDQKPKAKKGKKTHAK